MLRYLLCLIITLVCMDLIHGAAVETPNDFGYGSAAFVMCVIGMGIAATSIVLGW